MYLVTITGGHFWSKPNIAFQEKKLRVRYKDLRMKDGCETIWERFSAAEANMDPAT